MPVSKQKRKSTPKYPRITVRDSTPEEVASDALLQAVFSIPDNCETELTKMLEASVEERKDDEDHLKKIGEILDWLDGVLECARLLETEIRLSDAGSFLIRRRG